MSEPAPRKAPPVDLVVAPPEKAAPANNPLEELDLVQRAKRGDIAAYDDLVRRYQERIYATV